MRQFRNLPELLEAPMPVRLFIAKVMGGAKQPFEEALGGDVFLVEKPEDLSEITLDFWSGASALQTAGQIDMAQWIDREETYAVFYSDTTQAGGPGYFVPKALMNDNLYKTMELSNESRSKTRNNSKGAI